jgi:hypothetical protein
MIHLDDVIVGRSSRVTTTTTTRTRDDVDANDGLYYDLWNGLLRGSSPSSSTSGEKGEAAGNDRLHMAQPPTRGEPCGFVSGLELAIRYSIPYLEGSHDPDMMSEVVPRFEPFERCCMVILFVGGRGMTTPHPTSPPLLR